MKKKDDKRAGQHAHNVASTSRKVVNPSGELHGQSDAPNLPSPLSPNGLLTSTEVAGTSGTPETNGVSPPGPSSAATDFRPNMEAAAQVAVRKAISGIAGLVA